MMSKVDSNIFKGVMLNAYPDSIGSTLRGAITMLQKPEFENTFSLFYILPTFFNSDLDRGFSIIDYNINEELVAKEDLDALNQLNIRLKFDIVLNHLSVASPQFKDLLEKGNKSKFKDFFINWNTFWQGHGDINEDGICIPKKEFLKKLFMRKSGFPIFMVPFPDGSEQPYWNTFYNEIKYRKLDIQDLKSLTDLTLNQKQLVCKIVNETIEKNQNIFKINFEDFQNYKTKILKIINSKKMYLGQMDVNAKSDLVWDFYEETLSKLKHYGCSILRLDAFAYLHKEVNETNFFNKPGTWNYLDRIKQIAQKNDLLLLPEIHAEYGLGLHDEVANEGFYIYDFFLPGLVLHAIENGTSRILKKWANEIIVKGYKTINMLGCHDGIPVLDLKGKEVQGKYHNGLLKDIEIENIMNKIMERGGRVKNLYDPYGNKISYYQINATFFSALGEDEQKLLLARAIQLFMPGIPQIWYLDIFAGKNDYAAADRSGSAGHKEINRTNLSLKDVEYGLEREIVINQLRLIRLRNTSNAFLGTLKIGKIKDSLLHISWVNQHDFAQLKADLITGSFKIIYNTNKVTKTMYF